MNKLTHAVKQFWNDEDGITAVEYALIVAIMAAIIAAAWGKFSGAFDTAIDGVVTQLNAPTTTP